MKISKTLLAVSITAMLYVFAPAAQAADVCAKPNLFTEKNDFLKPSAPATNDPVGAATSSIENDFFKGGFMHTALGTKDNAGCAADESLKSSFLVGAHQGLSGNRFTAFYQSSQDTKEDLEAFKAFACTEYGAPKNANKLDYDFLLHDSKSAQFIKSLFELVAKDPDQRLTAKEVATLQASVPYVEHVNSFKARLAKELQRLAAEKGTVPAIDVTNLLKTQFKDLAMQEKKFKCCMSGFQTSFVYFLSRLKYSQAEPCSSVAQCKEDFNVGRQAAAKACETGKCEGCRLGDLLAKNKDLWLGCASAGFMDAIWNSDACLQAEQKKNTAASTREKEASTGISTVVKKDEVPGPATTGTGPSINAGSAKQQEF